MTGSSTRPAPPYGKRKGWVPRNFEDFGDGGAFPEIHVAQYPLNMGRPGSEKTGKVIPLQVDETGKVRYDALVRQNNKQVHSQYKDLVAKDIKEEDESLLRPSEEEAKKKAEETKLALEKLIEAKGKAGKKDTSNSEPTYIRYTPAQQGEAFNSGASNRVIRMSERPVDPLDPPKFKTKRLPGAPPSPPAPVMHSPPRKITAEEQLDWKIPPAVSNWKNPKGFTIPLDKRLAADGRGLQETTISDKFAQLSDALYTAERVAREEVEQRNLMEKRIQEKVNKEKENNLRQLAQKAREERAVVAELQQELAPDDAEALRKREEIRQEQQRKRDRELRMSRMSADAKAKMAARDEDRDISEKIALGQVQPTISKDSLFDQRLFNQTQGMSSGFKDEDMYDLYDKPLFTGSSANSIYRPKANADDDSYSEEAVNNMLKSNRFTGGVFEGAVVEDGGSGGPVQFEKVADPFGLDQFLTDAKKGKRGLNTAEDRDAKRARN